MAIYGREHAEAEAVRALLAAVEAALEELPRERVRLLLSSKAMSLGFSETPGYTFQIHNPQRSLDNYYSRCKSRNASSPDNLDRQP